MAKKGSARDYAQAIYELALEGWQKELQAVQSVLSTSPDLLNKLNKADTKFATRQKTLDDALPKGTSEQVKNFLYTLLQNGDLDKIGGIATDLTRLVTKGPGVEIATVTTAIALSDSEKAQFEKKLSGQYGDRVAVEFVVDKSIVGGVVVQVGDKIMDGSVSSKLASARNALTTG